MIVTKHIEIKLHHRNIEYYKNKGYLTNSKTIFVKPTDLPNHSESIIVCKCCKCKNNFEIHYNLYLKKPSSKRDLCKSCYNEKILDYGFFQDILRRNLKEWRERTLDLYDNKCLISGKSSNIIHHKISHKTLIFESLKLLGLTMKRYEEYTENEIKSIINKIKELHDKYDVGVCLSKEMHILFHSRYGKYNTTPEQFEEFYNTERSIKNGEDDKNV